MKKTILISSGIVIILLVIGVWVYLFMNGRPDSPGEVFTQLGISGGETTNTNFEAVTSNDGGDEVYEIDNTPMKLKQLTTKPVAGAGFIENGIRYVEQGTGHVYEINFESSTETLISGTTITQTVEAELSKGGEYVALTSLTENGSETIVGTVMNGELVGNTLPNDAKNISLHEEGSVYYTLEKTSGLVGYKHNLETDSSSVVFESPLQDVVVLWGNPIYVYTTPSAGIEGYVYTIENGGSHTFVTAGKKGLVAFRDNTDVIVTTSEPIDGGSYVIRESGENTFLSTFVIPEKCVANPLAASDVFCAIPNTLDRTGFPDDWYKGVTSYSDYLVNINIEDGSMISLLDFLNESSREIDVSKIGINDEGLELYLINKNDNTLWLYDRTVR